jgi:hypothetical protein
MSRVRPSNNLRQPCLSIRFCEFGAPGAITRRCAPRPFGAAGAKPPAFSAAAALSNADFFDVARSTVEQFATAMPLDSLL